jgi:hypothetical protein
MEQGPPGYGGPPPQPGGWQPSMGQVTKRAPGLRKVALALLVTYVLPIGNAHFRKICRIEPERLLADARAEGPATNAAAADDGRPTTAGRRLAAAPGAAAAAAASAYVGTPANSAGYDATPADAPPKYGGRSSWGVPVGPASSTTHAAGNHTVLLFTLPRLTTYASTLAACSARCSLHLS